MNEFQICYGSVTRAALDAGRPVVALESTLLAHGLPRPDNLRVAHEIEQSVRDEGAVPATIGMVDGELTVGLDPDQLAVLATGDGVAKLSERDLAPAASAGVTGATTVAASSAVAARAGIRFFATGGLGGVHRQAATTFDESADLVTLARTPVTVVCAGVKSVLDIGATLERMETLGITVVGYRTRRFPAFYLTDSGFDLDWSVHRASGVARILAARQTYGMGSSALVVANPLPVEEQLDPELHDRVLHEGLSMVDREGITGKAVTPFLLSHFHRATEGQSVAANIRIILRNASLAAEIAVAATP